MVNFKEALDIAREQWSEVDYFTEHPGAFVFSAKNNFEFGGNSPVVVLKQGGRCINYVDFELDADDLIVVREGCLSDFE